MGAIMNVSDRMFVSLAFGLGDNLHELWIVPIFPVLGK